MASLREEENLVGGNIDMSFGGKYSEIKLSANTILVHKKLKKSMQIYVFAKALFLMTQ